MKPRLHFGIIALLVIVTSLIAAPREARWQKVEEARQKGLPQTAIAELEPIIRESIAAKAYPEAIKAIGEKVAFEGVIQGNRPDEKITRLQTELDQVPPEMKPVMEAVLAHLYWNYFQQNRWQFMQRTQTASGSGPDLLTWDLTRILAEIDRHFTAALADDKKLKATPAHDYDELLPEGNVPDRYRPTMYDFLAYDALQFYQAGEHAATKSEDEFEIDSDSPIFSDVAEFIKWQPSGPDGSSPALKAIRLYQGLLQFHRKDRDRSAFYDADLARLVYGHNKAVGETKDERYKAALDRFIDATDGHEISSRATALLATQFNAEGEPLKAHQLAERGLAAFPAHAGGAMCFNLIQQIEAKSAQIDTEQVWNAPWPTLNVRYRNVTKVYFRAIAANYADYITQARWGFGRIDDNLRKELLAATPALEWNADLPATKDYKERTEELPAPTTLRPGFYFIISSHNRKFAEKDNQLAITSFWVSDLALVTQQRTDGKPHGGFVLEADSGEPVSGATVRIWERNREGWYKPAPSIATDANGRFQLSTSPNTSILLLAEHDGQAVSSNREIYFYGINNRERATSQTVFFTDRSLYRPGQTISYKGICIRSDRSGNSYETLAGEKVVVSFRDTNNKEIARATHRTNDYGSFAGSFTAPREGLLGRMTLITEKSPTGTTGFRVEEYKRPKFHAEFNEPDEAAKLGEPVRVSVKATAYTGAAIGGAKVKWRVEREVRLPYWCWWWKTPAPKAIAHGSAVTDADGTYRIEFTAEPDRAVPAKNEPVFVFAVHADVTDITGETRSADRFIRAGYTALQASFTVEGWQTVEKPVELTIETKSLDGDPTPAEGRVKIYELKQPAAVARPSLRGIRYSWMKSTTEPKADPSNPDSWDLSKVATETEFKTDNFGKTQIATSLKPGIYRASLETKDRFGKVVTARQTLQVVDPGARRYGVKLPNYFAAPKWSVEPGDKFSALWGTGYDSGRAFVELECEGKTLKSYWTTADRTQEFIEQPVTEKMRGGFTLRITSVHENHAYLNERVVDVPWSNKELSVKWESFRSKLMPAQKETWTATVTGPDAKRSAAEMVATLYDASLDQYQRHEWPQRFNVFRREYHQVNSQFQNDRIDFRLLENSWQNETRDVDWIYRSFPQGIVANLGVFNLRRGGRGDIVELNVFSVTAPALEGYKASATLAGSSMKAPEEVTSIAMPTVEAAPPPPEPDLSQVTARKNLNETAFFFPQLLADENGMVKMVFTMPEALTEWKFMGFAHDRELRSGFLTDKAVTAKDLMVEPNPPRFVREGDVIEFTVKVSNRTDLPQTGKLRLTFADAATLNPVDDALGNLAAEKPFDVPAKESRSYSWRIAVPDGMGFLTYKAVGATAQVSDGEEGFLPVLSRRILVTESLPLPIRGKTTKEFDFKRLLDSGKSATLKNESLTVQMVSQPAWYAVMALPYLMEYPYECSEQVFNRLYANTLARHIAGGNPKIRRVFDLWKNIPALDSPLEKNQDLKSVMLEETPWLRQAKKESQSRRNVGLLFDDNRLDEESTRALRQLSERQLGDGLWPWFPGGRPSEYVSLYLTTGFGRLRHLGAKIDLTAALKSLHALDAWMDKSYHEIRSRPHPDDYVPSYIDAFYLYGRSFFLKDQPIGKEHREALDFFLRQSRKFWLQVNCRQSEAHLALALQRFGDESTPQAIVKSLKERSVSDDELGMFWRDTGQSWWWYRAPIETQAMMIEAFGEVAHDAQAVEDCKVWLLKQKQTQDWKTTKATADAVYALLLQGDNLLASDALVEVSLGGETIAPEKVEAGTGFYEQKFVRGEIKPAMGRITVKKVDEGVSWGGVHWQYLEDMSKVTPHEGTPLKLKKTLFVKETTTKGQVLKPVSGPLAVGDELVVRIELRTDRDMEYVHLKDQRGSGTEPVNVLSGYRYQDGLGYYESTRDTASHFFIDYLRKGAYVFEYSTRVQLKGTYQTGIAEIQCMYAPEFNSHSESFTLQVK